MKKLIALLPLLVVVAGCDSSPRVDCASEQAYTTSIKQITESLPAEESKAFQSAIAIENSAASIKAMGTGKEPPAHELSKQFDGMTGKQVLVKAEEIRRASRKKR
jgi:hypothetical protein